MKTEAIFNHRSIRRYQSKPVSEALLESVLRAATRASTTGNMQLYSIVVTTDPDRKKELAPLHFNQQMVLDAPVLLTFCADINRFHRWCEQRKAKPGYDNFLWFVNAATDVLLAAQNACVEAEANGLGICYLGTTLYNANGFIDTLKLPRGVVPVTALVLGYPDESPVLTDRLPLEAIVHKESYKQYRPEDIDRIYAEKEGLEITCNLLKENQKETLAQVFTENRYKKSDNELFSAKLLDVLRKQGFID